MDDIQKRLTQMLEEWPDCVDDRRQFRSLLQDYIPQNKLQANLLLNAYDEDVVTQLKSCSDVTLHALQLAKSLSDNYGVTKESAIWSVVTWCYMLCLDEVAESIEGTLSVTSASPVSTSQTPPVHSPKKVELADGMYLVGIDIPEGNAKATPVEKGDFCVCQIYEDRQLTHSIFFEAFATQIYVTLKSGQLLKATGRFQLTFE